ncbi:MBL fold metallo-hydrolase, partial [Rhizobium leguminosarum]|uniref:MBL fold metallo-hydrolase n=1 Tax=Rhizobium leguminosarum TaxID=384 RepID=UPI003F990140
VLVHDPETGFTAAIDAPEEATILETATCRGWKITHILTTHHHTDHVTANRALKEQFGCEIIGPINEAVAIPVLDRTMGDGDSFLFGDRLQRALRTALGLQEGPQG